MTLQLISNEVNQFFQLKDFWTTRHISTLKQFLSAAGIVEQDFTNWLSNLNNLSRPIIIIMSRMNKFMEPDEKNLKN